MRVLVITSLLALTLAGCDRTTEEPPDAGGRRDTGPVSDTGVDAPVDAGSDVGADTGTPTDVGDAGELPDAPVDGGLVCDDPSGCWACPPTEPIHFLNGCTDSTCEPFPVTTARLPLLNADGSLPPLP